jgi:hypothetical protein
MKHLTIAALFLCVLLLGACSSGGPVRRVSEPSANIQQLSVRADGSWSVDLRIDNFSSVPMRFDSISLAITVAGEQAGTLQGRPSLPIGPETADVATLALAPASAAKIAIADALARGRSIDYHLQGSLVAAPEDGSARTYQIKRDNALSPVPGLSGVLR